MLAVPAFPTSWTNAFVPGGSWSATLIAFACLLLSVFVNPSSVVNPTKTAAVMFFTAMAKSWWLSVKTRVFGLASAKLEIGNTIITTVPVFVMNDFNSAKKPSNVFFHYNSMLVNVASSEAGRVIGLVFHYIHA